MSIPQLEQVVAISIGGLLSDDIHPAVQVAANENGITLAPSVWSRDVGGAVACAADSDRIKGEIGNLVQKNGGDKTKLALLVAGKSAGAVLAWDVFRRYYGDISGFQRMALVLVDAHGTVDGDALFGPYYVYQDLTWPDDWSTDEGVFRVYNIFQQEPGFHNPTGADLASYHVHENCQLGAETDHWNIVQSAATKTLLRNAFRFVETGE